MPKRHNNTIYKLFLRSKKTIKATPSSMTRIGPIVRMEDPKEAPSVDHVYIEEDTKVEETTIADIVTTSHPVRSNTMSRDTPVTPYTRPPVSTDSAIRDRSRDCRNLRQSTAICHVLPYSAYLFLLQYLQYLQRL